MELKIIRMEDALTHVALLGELDMAGGQEVEKKFMECTAEAGKPTIVDMAEVSFLASLGIRMLLKSAKSLAGDGVKMVLLNPQPMVEDILQLASLDELVPIARDQEEALRLLKND